MLHPKIAAACEIGTRTLEVPIGASAVVERAGPIQEFVTVAGNGPPLAGRKVLGVLKAETAQVADRSALASLVFGQPGLARVLDDRKTVFSGDGQDRVHVAGHSVDVYRHDRAGPFGDSTLDGSRVHCQGRRIGVSKDRQGLVDQDGVVAGDESEWRDNDLVPGVNVENMHAHDQGRGSTGGSQAAFGPEQFRVGDFELRHLLA
jgi:hypothetical protein